MNVYKIAVLPGDGIGPEVMKEALKVLKALSNIDSTFAYEITAFHWNTDHYVKHGLMMPENGLKQLEPFDSILFGAVGDSRVSEHIPIWELIMPIRKKFQQYINFRPIKLLRGLETPLKQEKDIDFVIIRENAEGEYSTAGGKMYQGESRELAVQNTIMTREGISRVATYAFQYAREYQLHKVTNATKSNAIIHTMSLWDEVVEEIANDFDEISYEKYYVDAIAALFVERPEDLQLVLASNLFGDILSDLGSAIAGGLGVAPSANINPNGDFPSMFEPVHGSAPDIAGQGVANPIAQIWSLALMLQHFGRSDLHDHVLSSIEDVLVEKKLLTPDIGGSATTEQVGDTIVNKLQKRMGLA
ncbi:tartrate dehydrogenase [Virgibacillus sp. NKC19-3]|uniref:tartrate dehydrogenase n=1 Tax=Virgibacillus saliphilus TaxID=2831674 RepID=UPI001C9B6F61|nr:tartrate dehydrogenase [Virgibacillus sp. NKC19-3]MBY7144448.1 tartrate dehydrogenase [Virgibacillus sp. NKC19-3]